MIRPQFTLRSFLVAILVVGAFLGGMAVQKHLDKPIWAYKIRPGNQEHAEYAAKILKLPDGTEWEQISPDE